MNDYYRDWLKKEYQVNFFDEPMLLGFKATDLIPLRRAVDAGAITLKDLLLLGLQAREAKLLANLDAVRSEIRALGK